MRTNLIVAWELAFRDAALFRPLLIYLNPMNAIDTRVKTALSALTDESACVLVTGANGFIGRSVCNALSAAGIPHIEFDRTFDDRPPSVISHRITGDISDESVVSALFTCRPPTHIVHAGGISGPAVAPNQPKLIHTINVTGTLNLLDAALRHQVRRMVHLSSIAVYGHQPTLDPVAEDAMLLATDYYGASKAAAEKIASSYRDTAQLDVIALRLASVYGPGRRVPCIVGNLYASAQSGRKATISASSKNLRQLIYINDCVDAILLCLAAAKPLRFSYNIATGRCIPESEVAAEAVAIDSRVVYQTSPDETIYDSRMGPLLVDAAKKDFGFEARTDIGTGLLEYWHARQAGSY